MKIFTAERKLTPSWGLVNPSIALLKKYIWHVMYLSFLPSLLAVTALMLFNDQTGTDIAQLQIEEPRHIVGLALLGVAIIWALLVMPAFVYLQCQAVEGKMPTIMECSKKGLPRLLPLVGMYIVATILIVLGFFAFIIPGFLLIWGFLLAQYYVVDQNMGPLQALKQSYRDSRSISVYIWGVIGVGLVFGIIGSIIGIIPVVGSILSIAMGYIYIFGEPLRYIEVVKGKLARLPE